MNFFETELFKIFRDGTIIADSRYVGSACHGRISPTLNAKVQFVTQAHTDHYGALEVAVINKEVGQIDSIQILLKDILVGYKGINSEVSNGSGPHIWTSGSQPQWYEYQPDRIDYETITESVAEYLNLYSDPSFIQEQRALFEQECDNQEFEQPTMGGM